MFCGHCGSKMDDAAAFCSKCGTPAGSCAPSPGWFRSAFRHYTTCWRKCVKFAGRSTRSEFWHFMLINTIAVFALGYVSDLAGDENAVLFSVYFFASTLPLVSAGVRRFHDIGMSGQTFWYTLIPTVLFGKFSSKGGTCGWLRAVLVVAMAVGFIMLIVYWAQDSQPGSNQYGPNPKENGKGTSGTETPICAQPDAS